MRRWLRQRFWNWDTLVVWPARALTLQQIDDILKEHYVPHLTRELYGPYDDHDTHVKEHLEFLKRYGHGLDR